MKKIFVTLLLLMVLPTVLSAETVPNNTIGLSPGVIEAKMLPNDTLERDIVLMRSPLTYDESYTTSITGNPATLNIIVPDNLLLPQGEQQLEFPLTINTTAAPLGIYDVIVTFTPNQTTTTVTNTPGTSAQTIAVGIATKIHITVVDSLTPAASIPVKNQTAPQPYWLWLGGGLLIVLIAYLFRNLH